MAEVTTKTGDAGMTGLLAKERVPESDPRIEALGAVDEALGAVDEATSALGLARACGADARIREIILHIQRDLYVLMGDVATPPPSRTAVGIAITPAHVQWLEETKAALLAETAIPNQFILPGDTPEGAALDLARTVVRRAECAQARAMRDHVAPNPEVLRYLNRLSDLVFVLARGRGPAGGSTLARPA